MKKLVSRRPSPAAVLAFVALVAALSGSAIALPGSNGVNSGDIKNNSVRSKDVRNNNLTGKDIKNLAGGDIRNDSLSGGDVNESSLGKVPSAGAADAAGIANRANSAGAVDKFQFFSNSAQATEGDSFDSAREAAPMVDLATVGPFTVYGKCFEDTSGDADETNDDLYAYTYVRTTENGGVFSSYDDDAQGDPYLEPGTDEEDRELWYTNEGNNDSDYYGYAYSDFALAAASGPRVNGQVAAGVLNGTIDGGTGAYGATDSCIWNGTLFG